MKLLQYFDCAYVINLPERKDRRQEITQELNNLGLSFSPNKIEIFSGIRPTETKGFCSLGARGCFLSHLGVIKLAKEKQMKNVLIMEDDLTLSQHFIKAEEAILNNIPTSNWGFLYLGHLEKLSNNIENIWELYEKKIYTAYFLAINSHVFDPLISFLEELQKRPPGDPQGGPMHVDGAYSIFRKQNPDIITLIANPTLGSQRSSRSDITPNKLDKMIVLKELAAVARKIKNLVTH